LVAVSQTRRCGKMKRLFNVFILAIVLLLNAGCAGPTPYQKSADHNGLGYSHYQVQDNIYRVYFVGVHVKDKGVYLDYWNRRAKELCEEMGFQEYRVIGHEQREGGKDVYEGKGGVVDMGFVWATTERSSTRPDSVSGEVECLKKSK
jgi:hypothetical protein